MRSQITHANKKKYIQFIHDHYAENPEGSQWFPSWISCRLMTGSHNKLPCTQNPVKPKFRNLPSNLQAGSDPGQGLV